MFVFAEKELYCSDLDIFETRWLVTDELRYTQHSKHADNFGKVISCLVLVF